MKGNTIVGLHNANETALISTRSGHERGVKSIGVTLASKQPDTSAIRFMAPHLLGCLPKVIYYLYLFSIMRRQPIVLKGVHGH